jgi:SAP domain-containing new25
MKSRSSSNRSIEGNSVERPTFSRQLSAAEFGRWYWLKTELVDACRLLRVSPTGSKPELTARIAAALSGTAIIACYRASVAPGAVKPALPPQLEYNRHMQRYAREHPGATRAEVLGAWKARRARPVG